MRNLSYENEFCMRFLFHANQSHFHILEWSALTCRLALKQRRKGTRKCPIKGHCQPWDCTDLDTSFPTLKKSSPQPGLKVRLEIRFSFLSVLLDFQSLTEKPVFKCLFAHPTCMILFLSYLVKNSIYRVSAIISYDMVSHAHVRKLTVSPFSSPSLRSFWPAAGIESSGSNQIEIPKKITEFCPSAHLWRMPEMVAPRALDSCRRPGS